MPLVRMLSLMADAGRTLSPPLRILAAAGFVGAGMAVRYALAPILPPEMFPYLLSFPPIVLAASLSGGAGLAATVLSAGLAAVFFIPPAGSFAVQDWRDVFGLTLFAANGALFSATISSFVHLLDVARMSEAGLRASERRRTLLLAEFRHRMRNDIQSLVGLLLLRARVAPAGGAREALREAAQHALGLARVHRRLESIDPSEDGATVDARGFVLDLVADIAAAQVGDGLRPVAIHAEADAAPIGTERAVHLGLVINELVTNAFKYAFPAERPGTIAVRLRREAAGFVLTIEDDGQGIPPEAAAGLGTRLLRALAAQLRGTIERGPAEDGGTRAVLRFPA
jgi:two-component sensor histidine kinase